MVIFGVLVFSSFTLYGPVPIDFAGFTVSKRLWRSLFLRWHMRSGNHLGLTALRQQFCPGSRAKKYPRWDWLKTRTSGPRHSILHYRWRKRRLINRIHSLGLICAAFDSHFDFTFFSVPRGSHRSHRPRLRSYSCRGHPAVSSVKLRSILRAVYIFNLSLFVLVRGRRLLTTEMGLYDGVSCIAFSG